MKDLKPRALGLMDVMRLFGGETMPLVDHLVEDSKFSSQDIEHLRQLLNRLKGGGDGK